MSRQSRYKPVGWRGEPHRHYLAAKGIRTRYNAGKYMAHQPGHMSDDMMMKGDFEDMPQEVEFDEQRARFEQDKLEEDELRKVKVGDILEDVTDIPKEVRHDVQTSDPHFRLSDAATIPGSLVKDAGGSIGNMVRFAKDVSADNPWQRTRK